jgi:predicted transcriptional regulator YdeE
VPYEVRTEQAAPRLLAAVSATTTRQQLGTDIIRLLDLVWPVLRGQGARTGHNVVIYDRGGDVIYDRGGDATLRIQAGVEVFGDFTDSGEVRHRETPAGEVAATTHHGEYSDMARAYAALEQWWAGNRRRPAGSSWEVYGDWDDDPARRRTDIFCLLAPSAG